MSAISGRYDHTCAVRTNGSVVCWGSSLHGKATPPLGLSAIAITTGQLHSCAINTLNAAVCWGSNVYNQTDVPDDLGSVSAIAASFSHTCALKTDGAVVCWGDSDGAAVPDGISATSITLGAAHTCALQSVGGVTCWGQNLYGQLDLPRVGLGSVVFKVNGNTVGTSSVIDAAASVPVTFTSAGYKKITATYTDATNAFASSTATAMQLVTGTASANRLVGTTGGDTLHGMEGDDVILGRAGNDKLDGGSGNDRIQGGKGRDVMTGGPGRDTFVFRRVSDSPKRTPDRITDFRAGNGDRIDLSKFDGNLRQRGKQRFTRYRGTRPYTGRAGELRFVRATSALEGDTTGDRARTSK